MSESFSSYPIKKCLNCRRPFKGNYCWNCGQKSNIKRLDLSEILEEFFLSPLHIHPHGLLYTFIWLFKAPGIVVRKYIMGERKLLHPAFRYLVLAGTFATIVIAIYHPFELGDQTSGLLFIESDFFVWVSGHVTVINLVAVPIFAIGTYIFFYPLKYNYAENLTLQAYIASQQLWILVLFIPIFQFAPSLDHYMNNFYSIITVVYNIYVVMNFFKMENIMGFLLSVLAYLYSLVLQLGFVYFYYNYISQFVSFKIH